MKVRVTHCNNALFWYAGHIGEVFEVHERVLPTTAEYERRSGYYDYVKDNYVVISGKAVGNHILKADCEVIENQKSDALQDSNMNANQ
ncbi:MAG TPA: hypothetical protein VMV32_10835 [Ignavibacteriaceae bacterium]|nr:hypothetical protein [Ignavibacteriaceae bacterium]